MGRSRPLTDRGDPAGGVDGVAGQLPLPRPLAPGPAEAQLFSACRSPPEALRQKDLQTVLVRVGLHMAALKRPALKAHVPGLLQLPDTVLKAVDLLVVVDSVKDG